MSKYIQVRYKKPIMAKDLTDGSKPGGPFHGLQLVCIHMAFPEGWQSGMERFSPDYIVTFKEAKSRPKRGQ
ncbi:MAG: hypothetical protein RBR16_13520 [Syntrophus sp. (in: bacteria)]|nr:hypothetical protein [Syntrophus sp. (in: bacteria)]